MALRRVPAVPESVEVAGYRMALDSLPMPQMWFWAVKAKEDGSTPKGVFEVIGDIRARFHSHLGDLQSPHDEMTNASPFLSGIAPAVNASRRDKITAYRMAIDHLPRQGGAPRTLQTASGGTVEELFSVIDEIRADLQAMLGDVISEPGGHAAANGDVHG